MEATHLTLNLLAKRCQEESASYLRHIAHDPQYCFELFRRAIVERNVQAWEHIYAQYMHYSPLLVKWIRQHPSFYLCNEEPGYFANRALERMWATLTPERFNGFANLAALLRYMQLCVHSAVTDYMRALQPAAAPLDEVANRSAQREEMPQWEREEIWAVINARMNDERERLAIHERFNLGMKPGEIQERHPDIYKDTLEVYRVLQNVLNRLRRDESVKRLLDAAPRPAQPAPTSGGMKPDSKSAKPIVHVEDRLS